MPAETYITLQGDAWDAIAYRLWGEEWLFMALIKANPEHLDVLTFPAGVVLRVIRKSKGVTTPRSWTCEV